MFRPRASVDLFIASVLILFLELACIRWFPAHVVFLSFFTNTVLLACFMGMSIGCLTARSADRKIATTPLWLLFALLMGLGIEYFRQDLQGITDVGNQERPEVVFFGAEIGSTAEVKFRLPIELVAGFFFFLVGAIMIGPGQELGRAFNRVDNRTTAYTANLLGSLVGIGLFAACSHLQLPPLVWFAFSAIPIGYFLLQRDGVTKPIRPLVPIVALVLGVGLTWPTSVQSVTTGILKNDVQWSPYYRIDYEPQELAVTTNQSGHQKMIPLGQPTQAPYDLPYLFQQETERPEFERILVIGAGSGNDLSRALYWCGPNTKIDAVEIDPVIQKLGVDHHPHKPYDDPRITTHLNDGRNFLRKAESGTYDLVLFALVDSLVLHSGYSNIRLESYLFTQEAFADVKRVLKPNGFTAVYNFFRQGWIMARLRETLKSVFETEPVVLADPAPADGKLPLDQNFGYAGIGMFFAGPEAGIKPLRDKFAAEAFWVPGRAGMTRELPGRFAKEAPTQHYQSTTIIADVAGGIDKRPAWVPLRTTEVQDSAGTMQPATDDWPFLYVRQPTIPMLTLRGAGLVLLLSLALWLVFRSKPVSVEQGQSVRSEWPWLVRAFLLGSGFMLIETKAVVQMALLFGSTWIVNTFVFAAILAMALLGNLYAGWVKPKKLTGYYIGLFLAIGLNLAVPLDVFLGLSDALQIALSCGMVFLPVLFAGVIFPTTFARTSRPDLFFGANIVGALVGGLAENASMLLGFRYLLLVALAFYGLSAIFAQRQLPKNQAASA